MPRVRFKYYKPLTKAEITVVEWRAPKDAEPPNWDLPHLKKVFPQIIQLTPKTAENLMLPCKFLAIEGQQYLEATSSAELKKHIGQIELIGFKSLKKPEIMMRTTNVRGSYDLYAIGDAYGSGTGCDPVFLFVKEP